MSDDPYKARGNTPRPSGIGLRRSFTIAVVGVVILTTVFLTVVSYSFSSQEVPPNPGGFFSESGKAKAEPELSTSSN